MIRYWIYDKDNDSAVFPLGRLLTLVSVIFSGQLDKVYIHRAQGYGDYCLQWDEKLYYPEDRVEVTLEQLQAVLEDPEEYFYWLDVEFKLTDGTRVGMGLHDSTMMFIDSPVDIFDSIRQSFELIKVA